MPRSGHIALGAVVWLAGPVRAQTAQLADILEPVAEIHLEERGEHLIAVPRLVPDPRGGWIYWDERSNDVRLYRHDGTLAAVLGREGDGPGEFRGVVGAARLPGGRLVAADRRGRVSVWTAEGDSLLDDFDSGVPRIQGIRTAGPAELILQTPPLPTDDARSGRVLHRVAVDAREVVASYFAPPLDDATRPVAASVWSPAPWVTGDTAYVALSPFDSMWVVPLDGSGTHATLPLSSRAIRASPSPEGIATGRVAFRDWTLQSTFPGRFSRLPDGGWIVQTWGLRHSGPVRGLVRLDATGRALWEVAASPELLGVDPVSGDLWLWDPEGIDPSEVRIMRERR